jgi:L-asparaginase II
MSRQKLARTEALKVELVRGDIVESEHLVSIAMVDVHGRILFAFGDTMKPIYLRSSAKPFQALPFVERGYAEIFQITTQQLAIMCASHSGTDLHVEVVRELLEGHGLHESSLQCGMHTPSDRSTAAKLLRRGEAPTPLRHNCSGKHTGMLLFTQSVNEDIDRYLDRSISVQQAILKAFSEMVSVTEKEIEIGIDGCSAPNFAVPLQAAALGYARLMDPSNLDEQRSRSCKRIVQAMLSHPELVAGAGRFDTELMQTVKGRLLAKGGAEGLQAIGIPPNLLPKGSSAGLTLKVHDGDRSKRAVDLITLAVLSTLELVTIEEQAALSVFNERQLFNYMNIPVGEIRLAEESRNRLREAYERI